MVKIEEDIKLDFSDVLIKPKRSTLSSRSQVELSRTFKTLHSKSEWTGIPIMVANITLKKSNGITTVDCAAFKPLIVKNCANKPKTVAKNIINSDFGEGNKAN